LIDEIFENGSNGYVPSDGRNETKTKKSLKVCGGEVIRDTRHTGKQAEQVKRN